jgi:hypothetical protein
MKAVALVTLDCTNGMVRRYWREAGNKPVETGREQIRGWDAADPMVDWFLVENWLQTFRAAWTPPEEPGPHPTSPLRTAMRAAA